MEIASGGYRGRSLRLARYDYARAGAYFVTVVVDERELLLSQAGVAATVVRWWDELARKFPSVDTDAFVVMPNHIHGIVVIGGGVVDDDVGADLRVGPYASASY